MSAREPRSNEELDLELTRARAEGRRPSFSEKEVSGVIDVVLARARAAADSSSRELRNAARSLTSSSSTGLRRVT